MKYDVIIIGAGPAGYVAAIRAGQVGMKAALVEKKYMGGMCLNWGCIPTKALIESARYLDRLKLADEFGIDGIDQKKLVFNWEKAKARAKQISAKLSGGIGYLLKKNGVDVIIGEARITGVGTISVDNRTIEGDHIIIATGSYPAKTTIKADKRGLLEIEDLLSIEKLPASIAIVGKGGVAVEMAQFFNLIGKDVTLVAPDEILLPKADAFLNDFITKRMKKSGINIITEDNIGEFKNGELIVGNEKIVAELVLNASMRKAVIPAADFDIPLTEDGYIKTNENLETGIKELYAIGDVNGLSYLAHVASAQGIWLINHIKGIKDRFDLKSWPQNFYTVPEMAQIGLTEQQLNDEGIDYKLNEFPLSANGKALIEGNTEGMVRLLSDKKYGQVLGVQIIAAHATDMIAEAAAYMQIEGTVYDIAQTIHAHPTVSEIFMEAGFDAVDKAIHK
ncbi:MAG: dihydrolipoyl dehydrogenase [Bacteroidota bacterium]